MEMLYEDEFGSVLCLSVSFGVASVSPFGLSKASDLFRPKELTKVL
jgi:hypothetical protein